MRSSVKKRIFHVIVFFLVSTVIVSAVQLARSHQWRSDDLTVWIFDVGQGDAIFIDGPETQVLIDGGPSGVVLEKLNAVLPFWDRKIDVMINTHPHADHLVGLVHALEFYLFNDIYTAEQPYRSEVYGRFDTRTQEELLLAGDTIDLGEGAYLEVLWPNGSLSNQFLDDPNDGSIVLALYYGETSVLLTGDIGIEQELAMIENPPPFQGGAGGGYQFDILKIGHHGSITSSHPDFLELISPDYSIISSGENSYGHPSPIVLDRLEAIGSTTLRTDVDGDIRIWSDGGEPRVSIFSL